MYAVLANFGKAIKQLVIIKVYESTEDELINYIVGNADDILYVNIQGLISDFGIVVLQERLLQLDIAYCIVLHSSIYGYSVLSDTEIKTFTDYGTIASVAHRYGLWTSEINLSDFNKEIQAVVQK